MVEIKIEGDRVSFEIEGWDKLWSLRSRLEIPLDQQHEHFQKLVIEVADPDATAREINKAVSRKRVQNLESDQRGF